MIEHLARRPFWLIAKYQRGGIEVLTTVLASGEVALPVFSFEEEARMFVQLGALAGGWRVRETSKGEAISVLYGPCAGVRRVVLDPLPGLDNEGLNDLLGMTREAFMESLLNVRRLQAFESGRSTARRQDGSRSMASTEYTQSVRPSDRANSAIDQGRR